jgi:hypothetical protein
MLEQLITDFKYLLSPSDIATGVMDDSSHIPINSMFEDTLPGHGFYIIPLVLR